PEEQPEADSAISPDHRWQIVVRDRNAVMIKLQTGQETLLTHDGSASDSYDEPAYWSPDSTKVVLFKTVPAQEHKVYLIESSPKDQLQPKLHANDYLKPGDRIAHPRPHLFDVAA